MLNSGQRIATAGACDPANLQAPSEQALMAGWRNGLSIINLRGNPDDAAFRAAVTAALGLELPIQPCSSATDSVRRLVWAGPDEWFLIGPRDPHASTEAQLRTALQGMHHAVTDVSGGYMVLGIQGAAARDVLAQGCPLDLHPRVFRPGCSAGSLFFKASIWLWQTDDMPIYEVLVRRSFMGYVWLMLERSTRECGLITHHLQ